MYSQFEWETKFFRMGRCCYYCGVPLTLGSATKDHLTPQARGGDSSLLNIVPACWTCNQRKGTMTAPEFRAKFPTLCASSTANTSLKSKGAVISYEEKDEPGLLKRLVRERDGAASWAWRNRP